MRKDRSQSNPKQNRTYQTIIESAGGTLMERSNDLIQFQVYKGTVPKPYMSYNAVGK